MRHAQVEAEFKRAAEKAADLSERARTTGVWILLALLLIATTLYTYSDIVSRAWLLEHAAGSSRVPPDGVVFTPGMKASTS